VGSKARVPRARLSLVAVALLVVLGVVATGIALSHQQTKNQIITRFQERAAASAEFAATYVSQQAVRERLSAERFLAGRRGLSRALETLDVSFGSQAGALLDSAGRLLRITPGDPAVIGTTAAAKLVQIREAESGHVGVSGVFRSVARGIPIIAIAVPFKTPEGRRVFVVGYPAAGSVLGIFVEHTIAQKQHLVALVDASGNLVASSPRTSAETLAAASPKLARLVRSASQGAATLGGQDTQFVVAPVPGTPWRVVIAEPSSVLFASISGTALWLPWAVFAVIALLALLVLGLFSRMFAARGEALEGSRLKSEFVATMSHEMRTPLNGVIGMTDLLRATELDSAQRSYVDALGASSEALLGVISDVLDFSKMEAGHLELDPTDFDLRDAVEEATLMLADQAHLKGLQLGHWVDADVPTFVHGDRARVRQILLNLLSNAVKFTTTGEVTLRVASQGRDRLRFAVTDTGIGIGEADAAALFEAFAQADQSTTRQYGGTGLGLAISRRLVELMGGEIGATPGPDGGSVFWFSAAMPAASGRSVAPPVRSDLRARRILVVDDNATNRTILEHYLRGWGVACESVDRPGSALEALDRASADGQPFELAVLDFHMPDMDGIELVREIRKRPALGALRIVMLSSGALEQGRLDGLGVSSSLTKPARQGAIYDAIANALARKTPRATETRVEPPAARDRGQLVLIAEDNEINAMLAETLLAALGLKTELAHDGGQAIEMAGANDYAAIFMDCQMPVADGFEASRQIRAAETGHRVPIIAMTALSLPGDRERCLAAGMDDYLSKPVRREELEAVVNRCLPAAVASPVGGGGDDETAAILGDVLDPDAVSRLRQSLTPAKRRLLVESFEAQQERCVDDILGAVAVGDAAEVRRLAHKLRGSSASLGAVRLRDRCQELELGDQGDTELDESQRTELRALGLEATVALRHDLLDAA